MSDRKLPRKQLVIPTHPDSKARLERCAEYFRNETPSTILEGLAHRFEEAVLAPGPRREGERPALTEAQKRRYLAGKLTIEEFGKKPRRAELRRIKELWALENPDERVQLSLHISREAYWKLKRYTEFHKATVAYILDKHARRLERYILEQLSEQERAAFLAGQYRRPLPLHIITEPFSNDDDPSEAA
jgi:hypothetical protein